MTARPALAKVAIARKDLGLDEETYRAVLERLTGKRSAKDCSDGQLGLVLDEFKAKGWTPRHGGARPTKLRVVDPPAVRKARALWISLHRLGVVRDGSDAALESFARRQLKVEVMNWGDQARLYKLIEALKAMAERAGWSQDVRGIDDAEGQRVTLLMRLDALILAKAAAG
jgi:phage gp16-like protein